MWLSFRPLLGAALASPVAVAWFMVAACTEPAPRNTISVRDDDAGTSTTPKKKPPVDPEEDTPLDDGGKPPGRVFAHTARTLYLYEPLGQKLTEVAPFSCLQAGDRMLDIAIDHDGVMYGTSGRGFLRIDALDGRCEYLRENEDDYPNSLTFVPKGTVDPTREALVGYQYDPAVFNTATIYVRIDLTTGAVTKVGELNDPGATIKYKSSGDVIALFRNGKAYLTVKPINPADGSGNDYLAEIDPTTGTIKSILGDTGRTNLYGLGQWAGTGYGFSDNGEIVALDLTTATATTVERLPADAGTLDLWYGAGVSTNSPTKP